MSDSLTELATRKRLLLARSALLRLQIRHQARGLRGSVSLLNTGMHVATSKPVRSALFALVLSKLGHSRAAGLIGFAGKVILAAKVAGFVMQLRRGLRDGGAGAPAAMAGDSENRRPRPVPDGVPGIMPAVPAGTSLH